MFCKYCGNEIPDGGKFCPKCGKICNEDVEPQKTLEFEADIPADKAETLSLDPTLEAERDGLGGKILTFAIMGLAFGLSCLSFLGIIFSVISKKTLKEYVEKFGETEGRASAGKGIGTAALAVSISFTAFWAFYSMIIIIAFIASLL
ncbi:MAG: zinc ribbon domain-containing protein [Ruminococcaceae bacterium]|nr:zinc ribbon domain-containing protein [Oscillospiraceae bacterium]